MSARPLAWVRPPVALLLRKLALPRTYVALDAIWRA